MNERKTWKTNWREYNYIRYYDFEMKNHETPSGPRHTWPFHQQHFDWALPQQKFWIRTILSSSTQQQHIRRMSRRVFLSADTSNCYTIRRVFFQYTSSRYSNYIRVRLHHYNRSAIYIRTAGWGVCNIILITISSQFLFFFDLFYPNVRNMGDDVVYFYKNIEKYTKKYSFFCWETRQKSLIYKEFVSSLSFFYKYHRETKKN